MVSTADALIKQINGVFRGREQVQSRIPGTPYQSGPLQIRYYAAGIPIASACPYNREYRVTICLFIESIDADSDLFLVLPSRAATLSLTVSRGIMEVIQGEG
jgi:hypothetical protein